MSDEKKQFLIKQTLLVIGAISLTAALLPSLTIAARRNHKYHASTTKPRVTPTPTASISATPTPESAEISNDLIKGQWDYMPGITKTDTGILVHALGGSIVSQDGVQGISNPPINLAGTYLKDISGNYTITAGLQIPVDTTATIQLYGNPPIIADEFRIEQPSVQMVITSGQMQVKTWTGKSQSAATSQVFSLPLDGKMVLKITRQTNTLQFTVNNTIVGSVNASTLFTSGKLWFGLDSANGEWTLSNLSVVSLPGGTVNIADGSALQITDHNLQGLQLLATQKRPGFLIGMAMALGPTVSDTAYSSVAFDSAMFGSITPENDMKMINLQPQRGVYSFHKADALVKISKQNGINDFHGHTLVFAEANPLWFNKLPVKTAADKQEIEKIMVDHITTVVKHFGPNVQSWDVVNEPIADYDEFEENGAIYRNHKWYQAMGSSYIIKAFAAAYAANPNAILSINEYGLEEDGERWDAFIGILKQLKIDLQIQKIPQSNISVGFQSHVYESGDRINPTVLKKHIQQLAALGFKAQISENDVYSDDGTNIQSQQYSAILDACISEPNCIAWRGWILTDKYDTFMDGRQIEYGEDGLFDKTMKPRPALAAMQGVLGGGTGTTITPTPSIETLRSRRTTTPTPVEEEDSSFEDDEN